MSLLKKIRKRVRDFSLAVSASRHWSEVVVPPIRSAAPTRYLAVAVSVKNEAANLPEWLDFHRRLGVEHFYLYDNGSTDDLYSVCAPYGATGRVTIIPWANFSVWSNQQRSAYAHALANFGPTTTWMGFFDIDEFMFPVTARSLTEVLREREHLPVLAVCGVNFGTGGHQVRPSGGVVRSYLKSVPMSTQRKHRELLHTKCFVRPHSVEAVPSAHWFRIRNDRACAYTERGTPLYSAPNKNGALLSVDVIRYNHYFTRSLEEFERKCSGTSARGANPRWGQFVKKRRRMAELLETLGEEDRAIQRLLEPVAANDPVSAARRVDAVATRRPARPAVDDAAASR